MTTTARRHPGVFLRARTVLLAALFSVTTFGVQASPAELPRPEALRPPPALAYACADGPSFEGWLTGSSGSTTAITESTSGAAYGYLSNVVDDWSCTAFWRYDGLVWANDAGGVHGNFAWGTLISSTSVACNWVIGSTDYLKANATADCPDTDAEYAHQFFLGDTGTSSLLEAVFHNDITPDEPGDFGFIHSDCESYYASAPRWNQTFSVTITGNRPGGGSNCDPFTEESTNTTQAITVDATAPTATSVSIAGGAAYTATASVTLTTAATDAVAGVTLMRFSNDNATFSTWQAYATSASWTLATGDGTKTVYAQYQDANGNTSTSVSDTIVLDTTDPTGTIAIANGATYTMTTAVTLNLTQSDATSGPYQMRFSNDNTTWSAWQAVAATKAWTLATGDGTRTVHYQVSDHAGQTSASISDTIVLDATAPGVPSVPDLTAASDTGSSSTDNITADTSPTFTGTAEAGATVTLKEGTTQVGTGTATGGAWTITASTLGSGAHAITATATDVAGNTSASSSSLSITIDTTAPAAPSTPDLTAASDTGSSSTDNITNDTTPTVSGTAEAGATVTVYDGGTAVGTGTATGGAWTITTSRPGAGTSPITAKATDVAGNTSVASGALSITIDTTAPTLTAGGRSASPTSGTALSFTITGSENLACGTITATDLALTAATFGSSTGAAAVCTIALTSTIGTGAAGTSSAAAGTLSVTDVAGNVTATITGLPVSWTVDRVAPGVSALTAPATPTNATSLAFPLSFSESVTGLAAGDFTLGGTATGWTVGAPTGSGAGPYTVPLTGGTAGTVILTLNASAVTDAVGNPGPASPVSAPTVTVDRTAPAAPSTPDLDPASDTGGSSTDNITNDTTPTVTGTAESGSTVTLYDGASPVGSGPATGGAWSIVTSALGSGTHSLTAKATDVAGNTSAASGALSITIDVAPPTGTVSINSAATYAASAVVTLTISATDALSAPVMQMRFSNDGTTWTTYAYATSHAWTLAAGADGSRNVSAQFQDSAGNWSSGTAISDTIVLDTANPTAAISINNGATTSASTSVVLSVTAGDATSGVALTQASNDNVTFVAVSGTTPGWTLTSGDGVKTVWYRVTDGAGRTTTVSDTISLVTDWVPGPGPGEAVPYQSAGWKYQQVAQGGGTGFEVPSFDDTGWASGSGAFASGGYCPIQNDGSAHTSWSVNTDMLVRRHITLAQGTTGVQVWVAIDNDIMAIYWNGVQIGGPSTHENCPTLDNRAFAVSPGLVGSDNVLAIRARDRGNQAYFDARVLTGGMPIEPALDGTINRENGATSPDPVQTYSGSFLYSFTDVAIAGRGQAPTFTRSYNSTDTRLGPLGPGWTHSYYARLREPGDGSGDLLFVRPDGNTDRFTRNNDETFSPSPATYATLVRNADLSYTVTEQSQLRWTFDAAGKLTAITDRHGNVSTLSYDANGRLITVADPAGRGVLTLAYTNNRLTSVTDWLTPARTVTYGYDSSGRLETVTDREGKTTTFAYEGSTAQITSITDARGHVALTHTYDAQGRVATQKDARGLTTGEATTFAYVVNGDGTRVTTTTLPHTSAEPSFSPTIEDHYTVNGWITQRVTRPSSTATLTESYTYDTVGNRTSLTNARGNRTDYCYDVNYAGGAISGSRGNLTRTIEPAPTGGAPRPVTLLQYDAKNNLIQSVTPLGVPSGTTVTCATNLSAITTAYASDLAYDTTGARLLSTTSRFTDPDAGLRTAVTKYEYSDAANPGLVTRTIPPRGNTGASPDYAYATTFTYYTSGSNAGLLQQLTDSLGNATTYDYDAAGRMTASVDPLGNAAGGVPADHRTEVTYDGEDRILFQRGPAPTAGGAQLVTETRYDEVGNAVVQIDTAGQVTTYTYDERDGLFQVKESPDTWTDPAAPPAGVITTEYAYDPAGMMTRVTRAKGDSTAERVTDYAYDGRNRVTEERQYPAWPSTSGALVTTTTYDAAGNAATIVDPLGQTTTYGYDPRNRLTSIDYSAAGTPDVAYAYDANGNRTSMTDGTGATSYVSDEAGRPISVTTPGPTTVGYRYDLDGHRTSLIYPDGTAVTYTFDAAGRLESLSDWASRSVAYTYFSDGALETATNPNGTVATYAYDNDRRTTGINHAAGSTTISDHAYALDPLGNVTGLAEGADTWAYAYDRLSRLDGVTGPDGARTYAYDPVGNRTSKVLGGTTAYTYDRADRITAAGSAAITLDANGNTISRGTDTFTYDQANRMTTATVGASTETSTYDGDGVRFSRQVDAGPVTRYVTDLASSLPVTIDDGSRKYVWGIGLAYAVSGSAIEVYHTDRLGSVRAITDASGAITATYRTDEFGIETASTGTSTQPYGFTGEPEDASGLSYLRARYYDPGLGRFTSRDTWPGNGASPKSLNRYAYALGNPATLRDPSGRDTGGLCITLGGGGGPFGGMVDFCVTATETGQVGVTITPSGTAGLNLGVFGGVEYQYSNAHNLSNLAGPFGAAGGSLDVGVGAEGSVWGGADQCGRIVNGVSLGATAGGGGSAYAAGQFTVVVPLWGPADEPCQAKSQVNRP